MIATLMKALGQVLLFFLTLPLRILWFVLNEIFGKQKLHAWKRARKVNVKTLSGKKRKIWYNGKRRTIRPVEEFQKDGYGKTYVTVKEGFFRRTKCMDKRKIR